MRQRFYIIFILLCVLFSADANSICALDCGVVYRKDKTHPHQEIINEVSKEEIPKTRSLIETVEVWNYGTYLEVIFNANIGVVTYTLSNTFENTISTETFSSDIQPIANINLPLTQGTYLLNIVSSTGYHGYAIITLE